MSVQSVTVLPTDTLLDPAPINATWILEGCPFARNRLLFKSADGTAWTMIWDCTAGRFNWFYTCDETVHVLQGSVTLTTADGTFTAQAGSALFFPAGSWATWQVDSYVRKIAFMRQALPIPAGLLVRVWRRLVDPIYLGAVNARFRRTSRNSPGATALDEAPSGVTDRTETIRPTSASRQARPVLF